MCHNSNVSIFSFIIGILLVFIIFTRNEQKSINKKYDYWNILFILSFITVQLGEFFIWKGLDNNNDKKLINIGLCIISFCVLMQPIIQSFGNAYFNDIKIFYIPVIIGLYFLFYINIKKTITIGPNHHLIWSFNDDNFNLITSFRIYYIIFIALGLLWMKPIKKFIWLYIYGIIILLISYYNYYKTNEDNSMWCFYSLGYAFLAYFLNKKYISNNMSDNNISKNNILS